MYLDQYAPPLVLPTLRDFAKDRAITAMAQRQWAADFWDHLYLPWRFHVSWGRLGSPKSSIWANENGESDPCSRNSVETKSFVSVMIGKQSHSPRFPYQFGPPVHEQPGDQAFANQHPNDSDGSPLIVAHVENPRFFGVLSMGCLWAHSVTFEASSNNFVRGVVYANIDLNSQMLNIFIHNWFVDAYKCFLYASAYISLVPVKASDIQAGVLVNPETSFDLLIKGCYRSWIKFKWPSSC